MNTKEFIEVELPNNMDAFKAMDKLKNIAGIIKVNAITVQSVRVYYHSKKVVADTIIHRLNGKIAA